MEVWNRYTLTAARMHTADLQHPPGAVDCHAHVLVPAAADLVKPHMRARGEAPAADTVALNRKQEADRRRYLTDLATRLEELDKMAVAQQIVMPVPGQCCMAVPPDVAVRATRLVNDGVAAFTAMAPQRLIPFGTVPLPSVEAAVEELERCSTQLGFRGVELLTNIQGRELSDPSFDPFWRRAEALGMLVVIHPAGYTEPQRLSRYYFNNVIGNPLDTTVALHHLIFDGVFERFPDLRLLAVHGGGYLPAYSGRMDHAWGARSDSHCQLPRKPSDYLRKIYVDTIVFTPHQLQALVDFFGRDHVLMGTDYPYDMAEYDPLGHIASVEGFDAETRDAIAGGNLRRLLDI